MGLCGDYGEFNTCNGRPSDRKIEAACYSDPETWKSSLDEKGRIDEVKTTDVHTFMQHLVTFGIVKREDIESL
ncbi:unnamed protein product [Arabis nemorensis]|uniref:FRIGIDA-like protein n=1 Tax=Arabis nemorensis TaxID=586526 RepID=A0A565BI69_9BRAS|nr:unnamed protein product [Arabis nemorensis]